jgi:hypothetical protein
MRCILVLLVLGLSASPAVSQSECTPAQFRALLASIRNAVQEENLVTAIQLLNKATTCFSSLEEKPLLDEEGLQWDIAQLNLERADQMTDRQAIVAFAQESASRWQEYIGWYQALTPDQLEVLQGHPSSNRISRAVRQLGNAIIRRGNTPPHSIRQLFSQYLDFPEQYHSASTVRKWRYWLLRCPTWEEPNNLNLRALRARFEGQEPACQEEWYEFKEFLEVFVELASLTLTSKKTFSRWIEELDYALALDGD